MTIPPVDAHDPAALVALLLAAVGLSLAGLAVALVRPRARP